MSTNDIYINHEERKILVIPHGATGQFPGFGFLGEYSHDTDHDPLGPVVNHVLYHHVRALLRDELQELDPSKYSIELMEEVPDPPVPGPLDFYSNEGSAKSFTAPFQLASPNCLVMFAVITDEEIEFTVTHGGETLDDVHKIFEKPFQIQMFAGSGLSIEEADLVISTDAEAGYHGMVGRVNNFASPVEVGSGASAANQKEYEFDMFMFMEDSGVKAMWVSNNQGYGQNPVAQPDMILVSQTRVTSGILEDTQPEQMLSDKWTHDQDDWYTASVPRIGVDEGVLYMLNEYANMDTDPFAFEVEVDLEANQALTIWATNADGEFLAGGQTVNGPVSGVIRIASKISWVGYSGILVTSTSRTAGGKFRNLKHLKGARRMNAAIWHSDGVFAPMETERSLSIKPPYISDNSLAMAKEVNPLPMA